MTESTRSAREVLDDHLRESREGTVENDLKRNYSQNLVVLIADGVYHGHDGLRQLAERLFKELPNPRFEYTTVLVEGEMGLLEWKADSEHAFVDDGADSYLIRDGKIHAQTIHYTVKVKSK
ncbi:nuclear transport factor 2 family protein [Deinococcus peraridilitoris]|uniref:SnoaL-like polyketide cyclase n=1 Tax=Deinococcus peraridilitoris (strain DSM 19664 / LMG 22246 / CIP 109416 / KR-200) TaxID=937777 RepID=L0A888_DEIPD|nr:nuclear transport factor 2 family protein [Deinococcus peraridilitoris]AFZ69285.1 SnoaL-like polyketide cyclase [Deinococcus peraridilitoris DSM 19664]